MKILRIKSKLKEKDVWTKVEIIRKDKGLVRLRFETPGNSGHMTKFAVTLSPDENVLFRRLLEDLSRGEWRDPDAADCLIVKKEYLEAALIADVQRDDLTFDDPLIIVRYGSDFFHKEAALTIADALALAGLLGADEKAENAATPAAENPEALRDRARSRLPVNFLMKKKTPLFG